LSRSPRPPLFPYTTLFRSRQRIAPLDEALADHAPLPEQITAERSEFAAAVAALQQLSELDRTALLLFSQHELPYAEIGRILNTTDRKSTRLNSSHVKISYA